ncbi:polar growth protein [Podila clonocystis]|nr:polar growth protein [Podila clonocystis]
MPETVWAIHNFEAEADDEISFHIGEPIVILQKDELYQDGWWEGTNVRGETGLFPMNYTVPIQSNNNISNLNHIHNNIHDNHVRQNSQQQQSKSLSNNLSNMHINQNPAIASPSMGSTRGFSTGSSSTGTSNKVTAQTVEESLNDPQLADHPSLWSIEQVAYWLRWCGFASVVPSFIDNEISGAILLELNLNNLKELDINSFGKRFNIMSAITTLKQTTKGDRGHQSQYASLANAVGAMYGSGPNIPPRMASQSLGPSPRASYDPRGDYSHDNRQDSYDRHVSAVAPSVSGLQSPHMRHQQPQEYDLQSSPSQTRSAALARSDTVGSLLSGASHGDYNNHSKDASRGTQRQSITSAFSNNSNTHLGVNQWDRNPPRPPQVPSSAAHSQTLPQQHQQQEQQQPQRGQINSEFDDRSYGARSMDYHPQEVRNGPMNPEMYHNTYAHEPYQKPMPQRRSHNPDNNNRQANGKADPSDKVVPLDLIGKPDYAGWLKKRGDTYRTWKSRWFMLKGVTLYYMNSPKDNASKDYINLIGYKIVQDENIYAGKYCFKAVHEDLRNFYFYTESENDMKGWLKALMKVTIGRDPNAPVISSSNIPTIPLHVARKMAPRPPSPSKRNRGLGPNGQPMHPQQQQQQQQYEQKYQQQLPPPPPPPPQQRPLDYDDQDSDGDEFLPKEYGQPRGAGPISNNQNGLRIIDEGPESPILRSLSVPPQTSQRHSFVNDQDDPWRDEDGEGFAHNSNNQRQNQSQNQLKAMRPDSELDSFRETENKPNSSRQSPSGAWTQEQYVAWMNRNLPETVEPVKDIIQSLRSGVVLVRLIEQLSGEAVDKRIPNATYTLQMLENLLTAFKFMDRVGISTDGYTVKDIFNGNEEKIVQMFESIRVRFPNDAAPTSNNGLGQVPTPIHTPQPPTSPLPAAPSPSQKPNSVSGSNPSSPALLSGGFQVQPPRGSPPVVGSRPVVNGNGSPLLSQNKSPRMGNANPSSSPSPSGGRLQAQHTGGSEYEALYDEAARSTISQ